MKNSFKAKLYRERLAVVPIRGCNDEKVDSIIPLLSSVPLDLIIVKTSKTSN